MTTHTIARTLAALAATALLAITLAAPAEARTPSPLSTPRFQKTLPPGYWATCTYCTHPAPRHPGFRKQLPAGWWTR